MIWKLSLYQTNNHLLKFLPFIPSQPFVATYDKVILSSTWLPLSIYWQVVGTLLPWPGLLSRLHSFPQLPSCLCLVALSLLLSLSPFYTLPFFLLLVFPSLFPSSLSPLFYFLSFPSPASCSPCPLVSLCSFLPFSISFPSLSLLSFPNNIKQ